MARAHGYASVAQDLAQWIADTRGYLVAGMKENGQAPFAAPVNRRQALDYYTRSFFNPDGTPNTDGRAQQVQRLGVAGYTQAMAAVLKSRQAPETTDQPVEEDFPTSTAGGVIPPIPGGTDGRE